MKRILTLISLSFLFSFVYAQDYIDEPKLFEGITKQVLASNYDQSKFDKVFETAHLNRKNIKVAIKTLPPSSKTLSKQEIFKKNKPDVYRFIRLFKNEETGKQLIENVATAFPISEDGFFCVNYHMIKLFEAGSGDSTKTNRTEKYFLADYDGNILSIDSVCSYNEEADVAIIF